MKSNANVAKTQKREAKLAAREAKEKKQNQALHDKLVQPIKVEKPEVDQSIIDQANQVYVQRVEKAFNDYLNHNIADSDLKLKVKQYKQEFELVTHGKYYHQLCKLHLKAGIDYPTRKYRFNIYQHQKEYQDTVADINHDIQLIKKDPDYQNNKLNEQYQARLQTLKTAKESAHNKYRDDCQKSFQEFSQKIYLIDEIKDNNRKFYLFKAKAFSWWEINAKKWANIAYCGLIILFAILGLVDQIAHFLITKSSVGSLSVFTFITLVMLSLYVIGLIFRHMHRQAGVADLVEAKYAKPQPSTGPIGTSSDSAEAYAYLDPLFEKTEEQTKKPNKLKK